MCVNFQWRFISLFLQLAFFLHTCTGTSVHVYSITVVRVDGKGGLPHYGTVLVTWLLNRTPVLSNSIETKPYTYIPYRTMCPPTKHICIYHKQIRISVCMNLEYLYRIDVHYMYIYMYWMLGYTQRYCLACLSVQLLYIVHTFVLECVLLGGLQFLLCWDPFGGTYDRS